MPDCDYCGDAFDGEDAYLDHLESEHYEELSRIDRRRVDERTSESGMSTAQKAVIVVLGLPLVVGAAVLVLDAAGLADGIGLIGDDGPTTTPVQNEDDVIPEGIESRSLQDSGDQQYLEGVESYTHTDTRHVSSGTDPNYERIPPTGGPHYSGIVSPGFYEQPQPLGDLVHNLEHGHVVIYYDPSATSPAARESLRRFAEQYTSTWLAVVVVPNPQGDPRSDYVLTAWGHRLRMDGYDARVVRAFVDEYVGRGPENPVR